MGYIGNQATPTFSSIEKQTITGDGSTGYTLTNSVANGNDIAVFVNNVRQEPGSGKAYTASGTTITFSEAITSSDDCYVLYIGRSVATTNPPDDSVSTGAIADGAVTNAKIDTVAASKLTGTLSTARFPTGAVIQTASDFNTTSSSKASNSWHEIVSTTFTPTSSSSTVLLQSFISYSAYGNEVFIRFLRDGTAISGSTGDFGTIRAAFGGTSFQVWEMSTDSGFFIDSPATTSQVTYSVEIYHQVSGSDTFYINRTESTGSTDTGSGISGLLVQELAG